MAKTKFYVLWKGRRSGIFNTWNACSAQVTGFTGAEFKAFDNLMDAENAFHRSYSEFIGKTTVVPQNGNFIIDSMGKWKTARVQPLLPSICVDAACSGVPGPVEWRGVETESRKELFRIGPYKQGTNNVGEFLAIVQGLLWLKEKKNSNPLYSDSHNAILWVKVKKCRTKLELTKNNGSLFELIAGAEAWLAENTHSNKILKWETEEWGENPADFGRK